MGRHSCCVTQKLRKGLWSPEEDEKLFNYITRFGVGCWSSVPKLAGLQRCGKSCRLRWINYLRPDLKRGMFSQEEEGLILSLHQALGNRWAQIAAHLPGRTDNEIKNLWNSCLKKKLMKQGIDPNTHMPLSESEVLADSEKNSRYKASLQSAESNEIASTSAETEHFASKPVFDPLFLLEFKERTGPIGYNPNLLGQYQQTQRPYEQSQVETKSNFGFNSMPSLTNFGFRGMAKTEFSENSASTLNSFFFNEAKESSSNSSNVNSTANAEFQMNNMVESLCQFNAMKTEESLIPNPWEEGPLQAHSSEDYSSFPLMSLSEDLVGVNLDIFQI